TIGRNDNPVGRYVRQGAADTCGHRLGLLDRHIRKIKRTKNNSLSRQLLEYSAVEIGLRGFDRNLLDRRSGQLRQERISFWARMNDSSIAETEMDRGWPANSFKRAIKCLEAI